MYRCTIPEPRPQVRCPGALDVQAHHKQKKIFHLLFSSVLCKEIFVRPSICVDISLFSNDTLDILTDAGKSFLLDKSQGLLQVRW